MTHDAAPPGAGDEQQFNLAAGEPIWRGEKREGRGGGEGCGQASSDGIVTAGIRANLACPRHARPAFVNRSPDPDHLQCAEPNPTQPEGDRRDRTEDSSRGALGCRPGRLSRETLRHLLTHAVHRKGRSLLIVQ